MNRKTLPAALTTLVILIACSGCGQEPVSVVLVYEIDRDQETADARQLTEEVTETINRRLHGVGRATATEQNRVEVEIYGERDDEQLRQIDRLITRQGSLEFAILATRRRYADIIEKAEASDAKNVRMGGRIAASWRRVGIDRHGKEKEIDDRRGEVVTREFAVGGKTVREFLVILEPDEKRVTGKYLKKVRSHRDNKGRLAVGFDFNTRGGSLFQWLTSTHNPLPDGFEFRLGVLLDEKLHSAPGLLSTISDSGQITGDFNQEEIDELVNVLNAGALPCAIHKVEQRKVSTP